jgi:hypothetical protein
MREGELELTLPGGLVHEGVRIRGGRLRPITGRLELALARAGGDARSNRVDQLLAIAIERLGEQPPTPALTAQLCPGDREYLLLRLVVALRGRHHWLSVRCRACGELLDLDLDLGALPVSEAGEGYPRCTLDVEGHALVIRAPVAADLAAAEATLDEHAAARALLLRCVVSLDDRSPTASELEGLSAATLDRIDAALDALCPAIATRLETACPDCKTARELELDPLELLGCEPDEALFEDVHALAMTYHWTEGQILALPRERRRLYLRLIDRDHGLTTAEAP